MPLFRVIPNLFLDLIFEKPWLGVRKSKRNWLTVERFSVCRGEVVCSRARICSSCSFEGRVHGLEGPGTALCSDQRVFALKRKASLRISILSKNEEPGRAASERRTDASWRGRRTIDGKRFFISVQGFCKGFRSQTSLSLFLASWCARNKEIEVWERNPLQNP